MDVNLIKSCQPLPPFLTDLCYFICCTRAFEKMTFLFLSVALAHEIMKKIGFGFEMEKNDFTFQKSRAVRIDKITSIS